MRRIIKGEEPLSLTRFRARGAPGGYGRFPFRQDLREALVAEQLGLCAYCQSRIVPTPQRMTVEHFAAQSTHPELALSWDNLLGTCRGGRGERGDRAGGLYCEAARGNTRLHIHPVHAPQVEELFSYRFNGELESRDGHAQLDVNTLRLNHPRLVRNRAALVDRLRWSVDAFEGDAARLRKIRSLLRRWTTPDGDGVLPEYAAAAAYWLRRWERRLERRIARGEAQGPGSSGHEARRGDDQAG